MKIFQMSTRCFDLIGNPIVLSTRSESPCFDRTGGIQKMDQDSEKVFKTTVNVRDIIYAVKACTSSNCGKFLKVFLSCTSKYLNNRISSGI